MPLPPGAKGFYRGHGNGFIHRSLFCHAPTVKKMPQAVNAADEMDISGLILSTGNMVIREGEKDSIAALRDGSKAPQPKK